MKPIKLYFAAGGGAYLDILGKCEVKNLLFSYAYNDILYNWMKKRESLDNENFNLIIDSGAFTVWRKGREIDIQEYINFLHQVKSLCKADIKVVNLDVIPGKFGETKKIYKDKLKIEEAAKKGYENLIIMLENGIEPIHVFHQGESFKWLDKMVEKVSYIGISPANDVYTYINKKKWLDDVFDYLEKHQIKVDTHGFGVWSPNILLEYPWTSCDSLTWLMLGVYGNVYYVKGGYANPQLNRDFNTIKIIPVSQKRRNIINPSLIKYYEKEGYTEADLKNTKKRIEINVKFFLALERWINKEKESFCYSIKNKLL